MHKLKINHILLKLIIINYSKLLLSQIGKPRFWISVNEMMNLKNSIKKY